MDAPSGYNNFDRVQVYVDNDNGVAIEIGKTGYSESIQPNYIYFNNCYFTINTAFVNNTATCLKLINGQYINFNKCDFVSYNKVFNINCSATAGSRSLTVTDSDLFAVYNLFYIDNSVNMYGINFINNRITKQTSTIKYVNCENNTSYVNDFIFTGNTIISAGGSEDTIAWVIDKFVRPEIKDNHNISYTSTVTNTDASSGYISGTQVINNTSASTTALNITKNGPFNLIQPSFTLIPNQGSTLTYTNMYRSSADGKWYLGNLTGTGNISW